MVIGGTAIDSKRLERRKQKDARAVYKNGCGHSSVCCGDNRRWSRCLDRNFGGRDFVLRGGTGTAGTSTAATIARGRVVVEQVVNVTHRRGTSPPQLWTTAATTVDSGSSDGRVDWGGTASDGGTRTFLWRWPLRGTWRGNSDTSTGYISAGTSKV